MGRLRESIHCPLAVQQRENMRFKKYPSRASLNHHGPQRQINSGTGFSGIKVTENMSIELFTTGVQGDFNALHFKGGVLAKMQLC